MGLDKKYLERHGNQWRVQMKVPERLREIVGKTKLMRPLHTDSLAVANKDRWPVVEEFRKALRDAERALQQKAGNAADPIVQEALEWRGCYQFAKDNPDKDAEFDHAGEMIADGVRAMASHIDDRTIEISERHGSSAASLFNRVALGKATPVRLLVHDWLSEAPIKARTKLDNRRAVTKLEAYLADNKKPGTIEHITRRIAGEYVGSLLASGMHRRTLNKDVTALRSYWRWLEQRGHVETNVWLNQGVKEEATSKSVEPREFTEEEMRILFTAAAAPYLRDAMLVAALSGMRVEEIARLKVQNIQNGLFDVLQAKTRAGERVFPIHSELLSVVRARSDGKKKTDYLFHELPTPAAESAMERSQKIVKAFTRFRRRLGVDDRVEGARQARTTFHSFRRWFITKAEVAGIPPHIISSVVGHERQGMTLGTYSGGPSLEQMRASVEAVILPLKVIPRE
jgi:integrase